jgi:hypothetical protein
MHHNCEGMRILPLTSVLTGCPAAAPAATYRRRIENRIRAGNTRLP